jgi:microsomal dipeptidase-like Zn-dependent dipeptidase
MEDGLGDWPNVTSRLLERGYKPADVQKIIGGNFLRVARGVWGA